MTRSPLRLDKTQRREKFALRLASGGEGAGRRPGVPHVGARAGRRAPGGGGWSRGELECQKREKKAEVFSYFPAAAPRFGARAGFPAREAAQTFEGGAWNPLPVPGESPARVFPGSAAVLHREGAQSAARSLGGGGGGG